MSSHRSGYRHAGAAWSGWREPSSGGFVGRLAAQLKRRAAKVAFAVRTERMSDNAVAALIAKNQDPFLQSPEWKALRVQALELYGRRCAKCGQEQTRSRRINVDHIKPRKFFPELALELSNLQPLCGPCNKAKGNRHFTNYLEQGRLSGGPEGAKID